MKSGWLAHLWPNVVIHRSDFGMFSFISLKKKAKIQSIFHILQYDNIHKTSILRTYVPAIKTKIFHLTKADPAPARHCKFIYFFNILIIIILIKPPLHVRICQLPGASPPGPPPGLYNGAHWELQSSS